MTPQLRRANRRVGAFLAAAAVWGCTAFDGRRTALPERNAVTYDQLVFHSDLELPSQHRLLEELRLLRVDVLQTLELPPSDEPIHVYLFETEQKFDEFLRRTYPDFPTRRAFFLESDTRLAVFAHWGDRVAEDLRHETTHGYLHSVVPGLPLWLDEGLAEYFEVPRGHNGLNLPHVQLLQTKIAAEGWRPNLSRLESITSVDRMHQEDYAEAWAWVHWMLHGDPQLRKLLHDQLQSLRESTLYTPLSALVKLQHPEAEHELCDYLFQLGDARK